MPKPKKTNLQKKLPSFYVLIFFVIVISLVIVFFKEVIRVFASEKNVVPDSYIVVLKDDTLTPESVASQIAKDHGLSVAFVYSHALRGFSATIPSARLQEVKKDSRVKFVSEDRLVFATPQKNSATVVQPAQTIPSGVSRIGISSNKGTGIGVAVIDTGITLDHPDLAGNIAGNYSCIKRVRTGNDDNGHGSHVAGTIAALNNSIGVVGVAPEAKLYAVKVLDARGSGTWSSVICGIDWVTANASKIKVANMSLGGTGTSDNNCGNTNGDALHQAICNSTKAGVTYVVAAGNESDNSANHVPSAYDDTVITVSALADSDGKSGGVGDVTSYGPDDTFASFSNYGAAVDLGAPGVNIFSTWTSGTYKTISGTSMATPHVTGAAAIYLATHPGSGWKNVRDGLINSGELQNAGHTDPTGKHPEPIVKL